MITIKKQLRKKVGQNIKRIRERRGWNQKEVAIQIGHKSPAYISLIEQGERNISAVDLILISVFLRISVDKLTKR